MTDNAPDPISLTLPLTLGDYIALRAYYLRRYILRNSLIFFGFLILGILIIPPLSGVPVRLMLRVFERNWAYYVSIILGVFGLVRLLPFVSLFVLWGRGTLPRKISVLIYWEGFKYTIFDTDVLLRWSAISSVKITANAYYINSKARIVRLPRRDIPPAQARVFDALIARNIKPA